jgi:hypothetical protein
LYDIYDLQDEKKNASTSWNANWRARFEVAREMNILHAQSQAYELLSSVWGVNAFPAMNVYTVFYENPDRKLGTYPTSAGIDWFTTMRKDVNAIYNEISSDCPLNQFMNVKRTLAQGFGSAPYNVTEYNAAHQFAYELRSPYHDAFICEFSKMTNCDMTIGDDDDESLYGKAHHDSRCAPDAFGHTCDPLEVMASPDWYTALYDNIHNPFNGEAFYTPYPPVFLANTAIVIYQALQDDPYAMYKVYNYEAGMQPYNIGSSLSLFWYWMGAPLACDWGKKIQQNSMEYCSKSMVSWDKSFPV